MKIKIKSIKKNGGTGKKEKNKQEGIRKKIERKKRKEERQDCTEWYRMKMRNEGKRRKKKNKGMKDKER